MGATEFFTDTTKGTVGEAFAAAVAQAHYDYGHAGYTGSIAEKDGWVVITTTPMTHKAAHELADQLMDAEDPRIDDKWGPAGAIPIDTGEWLFFGWASC